MSTKYQEPSHTQVDETNSLHYQTIPEGPFFPKKTNKMNLLTLNCSGDCVSLCSINFPTISLFLFGDFSPYMTSMYLYTYITVRGSSLEDT